MVKPTDVTVVLRCKVAVCGERICVFPFLLKRGIFLHLRSTAPVMQEMPRSASLR